MKTTETSLAGRLGGAALLALALGYGFMGATIPYSFASDPLGPRAFPVALAVLLGGLALLDIRNPGPTEAFPRGRLLARSLAIPAIVAASALLLDPAGFLVSIFVLTAGVGAVFGARPLAAIVGGVGHAALWWLVFGYLLEVYLPAGHLFG